MLAELRRGAVERGNDPIGISTRYAPDRMQHFDPLNYLLLRRGVASAQPLPVCRFFESP
jgi:hypothetical protein